MEEPIGDKDRISNMQFSHYWQCMEHDISLSNIGKLIKATPTNTIELDWVKKRFFLKY